MAASFLFRYGPSWFLWQPEEEPDDEHANASTYKGVMFLLVGGTLIFVCRLGHHRFCRRHRLCSDNAACSLAQLSLDALAGITKSELTEDDLPTYNDAAMRVNASRWAVESSANDLARRGF